MGDYTENITFFYDTQENDETEHEMHLSYSFPGGMNVRPFIELVRDLATHLASRRRALRSILEKITGKLFGRIK